MSDRETAQCRHARARRIRCAECGDFCDVCSECGLAVGPSGAGGGSWVPFPHQHKSPSVVQTCSTCGKPLIAGSIHTCSPVAQTVEQGIEYWIERYQQLDEWRIATKKALMQANDQLAAKDAEIARLTRALADAGHRQLEQGERLIEWRDRAEQAEAQLRAEGQGWQPIETAPKDGRPLWLCDLNPPFGMLHRGYVGRWSSRAYQGMNASQWEDMEKRGTLPTHWMPLPAPPTEAP
jgi:hypothetical protein